MRKTDELLKKLKTYNFEDELGHPLENCIDFQELVQKARFSEKNILDTVFSDTHMDNIADVKAQPIKDPGYSGEKEWIPITYKREHYRGPAQSDWFEIHRMDGPFYGGIKWAIRYSGYCMNKDGTIEKEPMPSNRDDDFYKRCRFDTFEEACDMVAKYEHPNLRIKKDPGTSIDENPKGSQDMGESKDSPNEEEEKA